MSSANGHTPVRLVAIAPQPPKAHSNDDDTDEELSRPTMSYTCQTCAKRKVKCDKIAPICSRCQKSKLECIYLAPQPRWRKRKLSGDVEEKLASYKHILQKHGLLPSGEDAAELTSQESVSLRFMEPETSATGKILAGDGKSRYMNNNLWSHLGDNEIPVESDEEDEMADEEEGHPGPGSAAYFTSDPLTGAIIGSPQSLLHFHPFHAHAMLLFKTHVERVEPICKILHIPAISKMVEKVSQQPSISSKSEECLLFAIYHFAVFSMTVEECLKTFEEQRALLMRRYHFAAKQALVNACFLKTTEISILQALVLFLLSSRDVYDPHTYWILTGVSVRIAQRIGLHRDGEKMGLPPFDVQMRRRIFYQILPLDGIASRMSGTGIGIMPDTWDTQRPLNINDDQIWPGMTERPQEQKGATEMIFCLARSCLGKLVSTTSSAGSGEFKNHQAAELAITRTENEVEETFIRYCDVVNPLHFLTMSHARAGITALRLRIRLPRAKKGSITSTERRELLRLSQKILETDSAAYAHAGLKRFRWYMKGFFLWGTYDSLILILTNLWKADTLSVAEVDTAWTLVEQLYANHEELLESKRALYVAFRRLTLKAWAANPSSTGLSEFEFISQLRSRQKGKMGQGADEKDSEVATLVAASDQTSPFDSVAPENSSMTFDSTAGSLSFDIGEDFNLDSDDWTFWDQLMRDDQTQGSQ